MLPVGRTALHLAASRGHMLCCDLLLQQGASVMVQDLISKATPLHLAGCILILCCDLIRCSRELLFNHLCDIPSEVFNKDIHFVGTLRKFFAQNCLRVRFYDLGIILTSYLSVL